jgi:outer membrane protein TolC
MAFRIPSPIAGASVGALAWLTSQAAVAKVPVALESNTPTLSRVVALAVEHSEVTIGRSELRASESWYVGARLFPMQNPYFEITGTHSNRVGSDGTLFNAAAWLPFEITGQRSSRIAEAKAYVGVHAQELEERQARARAAAVRAWGHAVVEVERIRTLSEIAASAQTEARAFRARRDVGDATERDAQLAEVEYARHNVLVEEARVSLAAAMGELHRLTGKRWTPPEHAPVRVDIDFQRVSPERAAAHSPLVRVLRAQADFFAQTDVKWSREAAGPVSLMLSGGQGTTGETVVGAGVAWALPTFRRFQGERARALAERERALTQAQAVRHDVEVRLETIVREFRSMRDALAVLDTQALPAAGAARLAAERMFQMGKIDILSVLVSRRDEALLRLRHLDMAEQEWSLLGDWVELSGALP